MMTDDDRRSRKQLGDETAAFLVESLSTGVWTLLRGNLATGKLVLGFNRDHHDGRFGTRLTVTRPAPGRKAFARLDTTRDDGSIERVKMFGFAAQRVAQASRKVVI